MVTKKKIVTVLGLLALLAGCGGGAGAPKSARYGYRSAAPAAESASFEAEAVAPTADSSLAGRDVSLERSPSQRPGLGTEWGETRSSHVRDVSFVRGSSEPFAVMTIHYDDRSGIAALASHRERHRTGAILPIDGGAISMSIRDDSGAPLEAAFSPSRTMVVGRAGERYSIVLTNHTAHRFEAVVTVDGLDVINGKAGATDHRGYVLMPFETLEIEGFRQSSDAVAAFRFASVRDSYAAQMGAARNVGVIGAAFFDERGSSFVSQREAGLRSAANPFPADERFARPPHR